MTTKTAKVKYTPEKCNVTDKITASYQGKELISKEFYIAPTISFKFFGIAALYVGYEDKVNIGTLVGGTGDTLTVSNFKIVDNLNNTVYSEDSHEVFEGDNISFKYTPVDSQVTIGAQFTVSYNLGGYAFTQQLTVIPVYATTGDYQLTIQEGKLEYDQESTVVLSSDNTGIATGKTITFTSEQGLSADVQLEES